MLDSYKKEDKKKNKKEKESKEKEKEKEKQPEAPDYSSFGDYEEEDDLSIEDTSESDLNLDKEEVGETNIVDSSFEDDNSLDNGTEMTFDSLNNYDDKPVKKKKSRSVNKDSFRIVPYIMLGVLVVIVLVLGFKVISSMLGKSSTFNKDPEGLKVKSKYDLKTNPNYITGKTWVCGDPDDNFELSQDVNTFFQYDFDADNTYAVQYFTNRDVYEDGQYGISLEEIADDNYTYKITVIASLNAGYKTRYNFYIITNKEGTKATYKMNDTKYPCEEMNYYNSKILQQ